jgi:hypothetical protein
MITAHRLYTFAAMLLDGAEAVEPVEPVVDRAGDQFAAGMALGVRLAAADLLDLLEGEDDANV